MYGGGFGFAPADAVAEQTLEYYHSTLFWDGSAALVNKKFFSQPSIPEQYENLRTPTPNTTPMVVLALAVETDFKANVGSNTGKEREYQKYIEENTYITWRSERKQRTKISLHHLLQYSHYNNGGTLAVHDKRLDGYLTLPVSERIKIPAGGNTTFELIAPTEGNVSFAATGTAYLPGLSLTGDFGHMIRLRIVTIEERPLA